MRYQSAIMYEYNNNEYRVPLFVFDRFDNEIPNISQSTLPIKFLKARYLYKLDSLSAALNLLHDARKINPYIMAPEAMIANIYLDLNILDSARYYSKKAFYTVPNNNVHRDIYFDVLQKTDDTLELRKAFKLIKDKDNFNHWLDYLLTYYSISGANNPHLVNTANSFDISKINNKDDLEKFNYIKRLIEIGGIDITVSGEIALEAEALFEEKNYSVSAYLFDKASTFDPYEYLHVENAAIAYNLSGDYIKSEEYFNKVFNEFDVKTGKSEFYFGVMLVKLERPEEACVYLKIAAELNYADGNAREIYNDFCR